MMELSDCIEDSTHPYRESSSIELAISVRGLSLRKVVNDIVDQACSIRSWNR